MLLDLLVLLIWLAAGAIVVFVGLLVLNHRMHRDHQKRGRRSRGTKEWSEGEVP